MQNSPTTHSKLPKRPSKTTTVSWSNNTTPITQQILKSTTFNPSPTTQEMRTSQPMPLSNTLHPLSIIIIATISSPTPSNNINFTQTIHRYNNSSNHPSIMDSCSQHSPPRKILNNNNSTDSWHPKAMTKPKIISRTLARNNSNVILPVSSLELPRKTVGNSWNLSPISPDKNAHPKVSYFHPIIYSLLVIIGILNPAS